MSQQLRTLTLAELRKVASLFREACLQVECFPDTHDEEGHLLSWNFENFPLSCCEQATKFLGHFLAYEKGLDIDLLLKVSGRYSEYWAIHTWVEYDGIIIDITADQFREISEPVIVAHHSHFHETKMIGKWTSPGIIFGHEHWIPGEVRFYKEVRKSLTSLK